MYRLVIFFGHYTFNDSVFYLLICLSNKLIYIFFDIKTK